MDDKVLVVKLNSCKTPEQLFNIHKGLKAQIQTGVVILPFNCEVLVVPKDIEVKVESVPEMLTKNCNIGTGYIKDGQDEYYCSGNVSSVELDDIIKGKKECPSYIEEE